jgi:type IV pilus assembly protein PilO
MQFGPRTVLFVLLLMALPIAAYFLAFKPQQIKLAEVRADTASKREKLAALDHANAEVKNLPEEIEKLRKAVAFFESKLPEEREMDKVLKEIWVIAERNGLNVKSVRSLKPVPGDDYSEQPIRMVIVGTFKPGFYQFLRSVEELPRITRMPEFTMAKDEKNEGQMTADLILTIFFEHSKDAASHAAADHTTGSLAFAGSL